MKQGPAALPLLNDSSRLQAWCGGCRVPQGAGVVGNLEYGAASHLLALPYRLTRFGQALDAQIYPQRRTTWPGLLDGLGPCRGGRLSIVMSTMEGFKVYQVSIDLLWPRNLLGIGLGRAGRREW
jgi:hypothetical protein